MSIFKLIDISTYQPNVNYSKAAGAIDGAILRCGFTGWGNSHSLNKDTHFEQHYAGFKAAGVPVGAYYYSTADTVEFAKKEADYVLSLLKGKQFELPIYYDVENNERQGSLSKALLTQIAEAFCEALENAGYFVGVYANTDWFTRKLNHTYLVDKYTIWLADYRGGNANTSLKRDIWQYSSTGKVDGITGNVDMNECYRDFPTLIKEAGLNGFAKAAQTESAPITEAKPTPAADFFPERGYFKEGDTSPNVGKVAAFMRRVFPAYTDKKALGDHYGPYIKAAVTEFQRRTDLEPDGYLGPLTLARLEKYGFEK